MERISGHESRAAGLAYTGIFVVVMAVCSWISIPLTIPVTLQTFGGFCGGGDCWEENGERWRCLSIY